MEECRRRRKYRAVVKFPLSSLNWDTSRWLRMHFNVNQSVTTCQFRRHSLSLIPLLSLLYRSSAEHSEGHPVYVLTPVRTQVQVLCIGWRRLRARPFWITPSCRQPHTPSSGFFFSVSGEWGLFILYQELSMAAGDPHTKRNTNCLL